MRWWHVAYTNITSLKYNHYAPSGIINRMAAAAFLIFAKITYVSCVVVAVLDDEVFLTCWPLLLLFKHSGYHHYILQ